MRFVAFLLVIVIPVALLSIDIRDYKFPESFYQEVFLEEISLSGMAIRISQAMMVALVVIIM